MTSSCSKSSMASRVNANLRDQSWIEEEREVVIIGRQIQIHLNHRGIRFVDHMNSMCHEIDTEKGKESAAK